MATDLVLDLDYSDFAKTLTFSQYKLSTLFLATQDAFIAPLQDIEDKLTTLIHKYNIDFAKQEFLDQIGDLLRLPRFAVQTETDHRFTLDITPFDEGYHLDGIPFGDFRLLTDIEYRQVLKCWGITLTTLGSVNDLITGLSLLFKFAPTDITIATTNDTITITFPRALTIVETTIFNHVAPNGERIWPKIAGITYEIG